MPLNKKTTSLFKLMERFLVLKEISSHDEEIRDEFGCSQKTLERHLEDIESLYAHIIVIKRGR